MLLSSTFGRWIEPPLMSCIWRSIDITLSLSSWSTHDISSSTGSVILFLGYCEWHDGSCIFGAADGRRPSRHFGWLWSVAGNSMCRCGFRRAETSRADLPTLQVAISQCPVQISWMQQVFFALNILSFTETNLLNLNLDIQELLHFDWKALSKCFLLFRILSLVVIRYF